MGDTGGTLYSHAGKRPFPTIRLESSELDQFSKGLQKPGLGGDSLGLPSALWVLPYRVNGIHPLSASNSGSTELPSGLLLDLWLGWIWAPTHTCCLSLTLCCPLVAANHSAMQGMEDGTQTQTG